MRLQNKYVLINTPVHATFNDRVEVEVDKHRCKVYEVIPSIHMNTSIKNIHSTDHQQLLTTWLVDKDIVQRLLSSHHCLAIVDGSFFPKHLEYISAYWKFIYNRRVFGKGNFVAKVTPHLQSAYAAEVCGGLGILSSVKQIMDALPQKNLIDLTIGTDCQSAIHRFSSKQHVVSFDSALSYKVREFLHIKETYIRRLQTIKISGHQDKVKKHHELSFEERINILCDDGAKELIREQIVVNGNPPFPFQFSSLQVFN